MRKKIRLGDKSILSINQILVFEGLILGKSGFLFSPKHSLGSHSSEQNQHAQDLLFWKYFLFVIFFFRIAKRKNIYIKIRNQIWYEKSAILFLSYIAQP